MILIKNVQTIDGDVIDQEIESRERRVIDGKGLLLLPAMIDPHVHFRTPGLEHKEDWMTAAKAAIRGGITTVFDMPNTVPACVTVERLQEKKAIIDRQLEEVGIPLRYHLYLGADKTHFDQIYPARNKTIGLKVFMGCSTGDLVMDDDSSLHAAFSLATAHQLVLAVHAEDEMLMQERKKQFANQTDPRTHSQIRNHEVAVRATQKAIELAKIYRTQLYLLHISTKEELSLIKHAKEEGLRIFAETTPHHLFLNEDDYEKWGTKVQMNPPLRTRHDNEALWKGIHDKVIDTLGSDHAPHTLQEKDQPYGKAPSGVPGVETMLPLMLDAHLKGKLSLHRLVQLMRTRVQDIFLLPPNDDWILVDLNKIKRVEDSDMKTKCGWSPYTGRTLQGWPVYTILRGKIFEHG